MKVLKSVLAVSLALATCGAAIASDGGAGMINGRHDFVNRSNFLGAQAGGPGVKVGLCTYCHTPHSAVTTALLWNRNAVEQVYTWDETLTSAGTPYASIDSGPIKTYKGPSVKCLACHDASVAIGDVAWYKGKANASYNSFKVGEKPTNYDGLNFYESDSRPQFIIGSGGLMKGNHPVAMPYPTVPGAVYNDVTSNASKHDYRTASEAHQVSTTTVGGGKEGGTGKYRVVAGAANSYIKLYQQDGSLSPTSGFSDAEAGNTGIECSSCHDPHNKQTSDDWMLRGKAQGSTVEDGYICVQCHSKGDAVSGTVGTPAL